MRLWTDVDDFRAAAKVARNTREPEELTGEPWKPTEGNSCRLTAMRTGSRTTGKSLQALYLDLRVGLATVYEERAVYRLSIEILAELVAEEPGCEEINAALMRLYALTGRRRKALDQYEQYKKLAKTHVVEPGTEPEIEDLYERIRAGDFPPVANPIVQPSPSKNSHPNNLPVRRTSFIGREREISEVKDLLERKRLLTLTGVGGSGKTRLAIETARELLDNYPGGVWMVGLSSISDPSLVSQAAAQALARARTTAPPTGGNAHRDPGRKELAHLPR